MLGRDPYREAAKKYEKNKEQNLRWVKRQGFHPSPSPCDRWNRKC